MNYVYEQVNFAYMETGDTEKRLVSIGSLNYQLCGLHSDMTLRIFAERKIVLCFF